MKTIFFMLVSLVAVSSMAAEYGDAGCGLGSVVLGKDGNQILASTTNGTGTQSFGITSGTSNCVDSGAVRASHQVPLYIEINRIALAKDAARGEGETLSGLAQLMGCQEKDFGSAVKANYNSIFVKSEMKAAGIQTGITQAIAGTCGSVAKN